MLVALLFAGISGTSLAQEGKFKNRSPKERAERQTEALATNLKLSDEQRAKVHSINLATAEKFQAEGTQNKEEMRKLRAEKDDQLKAVFSDQQYQQYAKLKAERNAKMKSHRKEAGQKTK